MNPNFSNSTMNMPPPNPNPNVNPNPNPNPNADYNSNSISNSNSNYSYFTQQAIRAGYVTDDVRRREYDGFPTNDVSNRQFTGYNYTGDRVRHREYDGFPTTDIRRPEYDYMPNPVNTRVSGSSSGSGPVSGLSQREIEKERIRKEIIAEEMIRRRILEEEVRREMMLDRDLPIRGDVRIGGGSSMRVDPWRVPSFDYGGGGVLSHREADYRAGFSTTPSYKRPVVGSGSGSYLTLHERKAVNGGIVGPSEISRDKAIVLAKRRDNITDRKRKPPMTPPVRGAIEVFKKPKPNEGWSCSLCQITTTSERGLNDHLRGKKHQLRADGAVGHNKIGFGTEPVPGKLSSNTVKPFALPSVTGTSSLKKNNHNLLKLKSTSVGKKGIGNVKGKTAATANIKKKFRYFCEVCQVGANSTIVFDAHKKGKRHLAVLSDLNKNVETALVGESSEKAVTEENGVLVEKSSEETGVVKRVNGNGKGKGKAKVKTPLTDKPKKKFTFFCEMCKVGSNSMTVFNTHKVGKKHLANLSELNKTDEAPPVEASAEKAMTEENKELVTKEYFDGVVSKAEDVETVLEVEGDDVSRVGYVETGLEVEGGDAIQVDDVNDVHTDLE